MKQEPFEIPSQRERVMMDGAGILTTMSRVPFSADFAPKLGAKRSLFFIDTEFCSTLSTGIRSEPKTLFYTEGIFISCANLGNLGTAKRRNLPSFKFRKTVAERQVAESVLKFLFCIITCF